jgi:hypothetical protein
MLVSALSFVPLVMDITVIFELLMGAIHAKQPVLTKANED